MGIQSGKEIFEFCFHDKIQIARLTVRAANVDRPLPVTVSELC